MVRAVGLILESLCEVCDISLSLFFFFSRLSLSVSEIYSILPSRKNQTVAHRVQKCIFLTDYSPSTNLEEFPGIFSMAVCVLWYADADQTFVNIFCY